MHSRIEDEAIVPRVKRVEDATIVPGVKGLKTKIVEFILLCRCSS